MIAWSATPRRLRDRWVLTSAVLAIVLLAAAYTYGSWVYSAATNVESMLDRAEDLDVAAIASGDSVARLAAQALIDESSAATESLSSRLRPSRVAAASLGWVPWAGDQLRAPSLLTARAEAALRSTGPVIAAADDLFRLQRIMTTDGLMSDSSSAELNRFIESLQLHSAESAPLLADVRMASAKMEGLGLIGLFDSRARRISSLEKRWFAFGDLLTTAPAAVSAARDVAAISSDVIDKSRAVSTTVSLVVISDAITGLAAESQVAAQSMSLLEIAAQTALPGTEFSALISDLAASMHAVADLSSGLSTIVESLSTVLEILKESDGPLLSNGDVLQLALELLVARRDELRDATDSSTNALEVLSALVASGRGEFLPAEVNDALAQQAETFLSAGRLMWTGPELLLNLIAADTTKKYLVLGQTSDELRAAGGFTSSVWTLTFTDGSLTDTEYIPVLDFETPASAAGAPPPAEPLAYYMDARALYLRDVGWDPDYASVGSLAADLYRLNQSSEVDGVISVTQWGIIRLVEAVGGIEVDGEFISAVDVLSVIEEETDQGGTGFLQHLFVGLLESLRGDASAGTQFELLQAINEIVEQKDLMLFSEDAKMQELIESVGWAGRLPVNGRDRLAVVDSNVGWSKSDRSIERGANYRVDLTQLDRPTTEVTLRYRNVGSDVGRDCSSHSPPLGRFAFYDVSRHSCYWNYVRTYVAIGAEPVSAPNLPLPENSVPDLLDLQQPGSTTFSHVFDESGDHFAGLLTVGPGEEREFSISYLLPASVIKRTESSVVYELEMVAQPGARGRDITVMVRLPSGYAVDASSHEPVTSAGGELTFEFDLQTDQLLRLEMVSG